MMTRLARIVFMNLDLIPSGQGVKTGTALRVRHGRRGRASLKLQSMSDDPAKIILGEGAISAFEQQRGLFRRRRRPKDAPPPLLNCENCGTELRGHWCSKCGQPAIDYKRSFRHVIVDLLESFLNWDSKFFTTIGLLLTRPWR